MIFRINYTDIWPEWLMGILEFSVNVGEVDKMERYVSEAYLHTSVKLHLSVPPTSLPDYISANEINNVAGYDFGTLKFLRRSLDDLSLEHNFFVKQSRRSSQAAKWECHVSGCTFYVCATRRLDGRVLVSSMDLTHNHVLNQPQHAPRHEGIRHDKVSSFTFLEYSCIFFIEMV